MSYVYKFIPSGQPIQKPAKQSYIDDVQESLREYFYQSVDWFTIQEETSVGSEQYQNVDVRVNNVINPTTADNVEADFKKIIFPDLDHSVNLGRMYYFDNNYWITVNVDKLKTLAQTVLIRRCNNTLRWIDEQTGAYYQVPCSIGYLIKENRDYSTAGSAMVVPSGMIDCFYQINSKTNKIKPNQRFLFGNQNNWTAYRIEGGGINNFQNTETMDNSSAYLGRFGMAVDFSNTSTDNLVDGIANFYDNQYTITLDKTSISGATGQSIQLYSTVKLNGESVSRNIIWSSSNSAIATVNSSGLVSFISQGSATITATMENNSSVYNTCSVLIGTSPVDTYQVVISPNSNYVLEGLDVTYTVYLYKNNVQQADSFVFSIDSNDIPAYHYTYTVLGNNSFKIKNNKMFLGQTLDITCTSGAYSQIISVHLRGAW